MTKLNIDGMDANVIDCTDKVVTIKVPMAIDFHKYTAVRDIMKRIKETCNAKEVIAIPSYISFQVGDVDGTIDTIDMIDRLNKEKTKLESMR